MKPFTATFDGENLGRFDTLAEATKAHCDAERQWFETAKLNVARYDADIASALITGNYSTATRLEGLRAGLLAAIKRRYLA